MIRVWREGRVEHGLRSVVPIPGDHGPVRIVGATGWALSLISADGTRHVFDASTLKLTDTR